VDSKRHIVVYISGPLSANTADGWWSNVTYARFQCRRLWVLGVTPICPHLNNLFMEEAISYEEFLRGDLELVKRSDAMYMIGDWEDSRGAKAERDYAISISKPVFSDLTQLRWWVRDQPTPKNKEEKQ